MSVREKIKSAGNKLVFTNGCFDILHRGHCEYLFQARQLGDFLVIGINTDSSVQRLKGHSRPINSLEHRAYTLASLYFVDAIIPFAESTPLVLIKLLRPEFLVKGADYQLSEIVGAEEMKKWGGNVIRLPLVPGISTSSIISRIKNIAD